MIKIATHPEKNRTSANKVKLKYV